MGVNGRWAGRGVWSVIGLALAFGIAVLVIVLASSRSVRLDVTSTGRLALSPRTQQVLAEAGAGTEVVLAASLAGRSRSGSDVRRALDMLEEIGRDSERVKVSVIDTSSGSGQAEFEALVRRLAARDADALAAAESRVRGALESLVRASGSLGAFADDLDGLRGSVDASASADLGSRASRLRATAEQVGPMGNFVGGLLARELAGERLPDLVESRRVLVESADAVRTLLRVTGNQLTALGAAEGLDDETRNRVAGLENRVKALADVIGALSAGLQAESLPSVVRVVGALTASEALLVLGPAGMAAVAMEDLFPPLAPGAAGTDPGRRVEALVTNALATLDASGRPMIVITHAGTSRVLSGGADGPMASLRKRSGLRGVEWVEWPVVIEPERPGALAAAKADGRPVVYVVIGIDTSAQGGAERSARSAAVLEDLLSSGERVMVNLAPSTLPGQGEDDPMAEVLAAIGLVADSGRPVLSETRRGDGRLVAWEQVVVGAGGTGLAESVGGLAVAVPWPVVIERSDAQADAAVVLSLRDGAWREGEWLGYWVTPPQQRAMLVEKPEPGGTRDADASGSAIVWQLERNESRVMVVGSHLWLFDSVADRPAVVDGLVVQQNPGNAELFLAGVEWLAGNDGLLGRSAAAFETPTVQPIDASRLSLIRWLLVAGLPVGVLLVGVAFRVACG